MFKPDDEPAITAMRAHARDPGARASGQVQEIRTTDNSGLYIEHAKKFYQQLDKES